MDISKDCLSLISQYLKIKDFYQLIDTNKEIYEVLKEEKEDRELDIYIIYEDYDGYDRKKIYLELFDYEEIDVDKYPYMDIIDNIIDELFEHTSWTCIYENKDIYEAEKDTFLITNCKKYDSEKDDEDYLLEDGCIYEDEEFISINKLKFVKDIIDDYICDCDDDLEYDNYHKLKVYYSSEKKETTEEFIHEWGIGSLVEHRGYWSKSNYCEDIDRVLRLYLYQEPYQSKYDLDVPE